MQGEDHQAKVEIDLLDSYQGARQTITLRMPVVDTSGRAVMQDRQLEVNIPKGVRKGQHLRLVGQGAAGRGGAPAGDLYAVLMIAVPPATSPPQNEAYRALARAFADHNPRHALEAHDHG